VWFGTVTREVCGGNRKFDGDAELSKQQAANRVGGGRLGKDQVFVAARESHLTERGPGGDGGIQSCVGRACNRYETKAWTTTGSRERSECAESQGRGQYALQRKKRSRGGDRQRPIGSQSRWQM